jgi:phosphotransferase system HPr (HPr) family protein
MLTEIKITKPGGVKAEDCTVLAQAASTFLSDVFLIKSNKKVNAKSVMGLISLNVKKDEVVYLSVVGEDEKQATQKLKALLLR